jgi:hypothetical protein
VLLVLVVITIIAVIHLYASSKGYKLPFIDHKGRGGGGGRSGSGRSNDSGLSGSDSSIDGRNHQRQSQASTPKKSSPATHESIKNSVSKDSLESDIKKLSDLQSAQTPAPSPTQQPSPPLPPQQQQQSPPTQQPQQAPPQQPPQQQVTSAKQVLSDLDRIIGQQNTSTGSTGQGQSTVDDMLSQDSSLLNELKNEFK